MFTAEVNKDALAAYLKKAIDGENQMYHCCSYMIPLVRNGRIRNNLASIAAAAKASRDYLLVYLNSLSFPSSGAMNIDASCGVKLESFSLLGAVTLGLEITSNLIKYYRVLQEMTDNPDEKDVFRRLFIEKNKQKTSLRDEMDFILYKEARTNEYNPAFISGFWR